MDKQSKADKAPADKAPAEPVAASGDLSEAIEGSVEKEPGEEVRSVRVYGDHYRCNFWVKDHTPGPVYLSAGRISRSRFVRATMSGDKLIIEDMGPKTTSGQKNTRAKGKVA